MGFGYPDFLWFLLALLIPVIVHLFFFRRIKEVLFSNVSSLIALQLTKKNSRKLKKYLLLASRLLFFLFLILTFVQLLLSRNESNGFENDKILLFLDNSISLSIPSINGNEGLNSSIEFANLLIQGTSIESDIAIYTNDETVNKRLNKFSSLEQLSSISYGSTNRDFISVFLTSIREFPNSTSYIISDFQNVDTDKLIKALDRKTELVQVVPEYSYNVFIDTVFLQSAFYNPVAKNSLIIRLNIQGTPEISELQIKVLNENRLLTTSQVTLQRGQTQEINVDILPKSLTSEKLIIEINDPNVLFDNKYHFSLPTYQDVEISYLYENDPNPYLVSAFGNDLLFDFRSMKTEDISYDILEASELIILDGFEQIPPLFDNLKDKVFLIVPAVDANFEDYSLSLKMDMSATGQAGKRALDERSLSHYLFQSSFSDIESNIDLPVFQNIIDLSGYEEKILFDQFDEPLLVKNQNGNGNRTYLFTSPLDVSYTSIPNHSIFIPLLYGIAFDAGFNSKTLTFRLDEEYLPIGNLQLDLQKPVTLLGRQNSYFAQLINNQIGLQLIVPEEMQEPGFYIALHEIDTLFTLAMNQSKYESIMKFPTSESLKALAEQNPMVGHMVAGTGPEASEILRGENSSLWKITLALALLFLLCEILITRLL